MAYRSESISMLCESPKYPFEKYDTARQYGNRVGFDRYGDMSLRPVGGVPDSRATSRSWYARNRRQPPGSAHRAKASVSSSKRDRSTAVNSLAFLRSLVVNSCRAMSDVGGRAGATNIACATVSANA